MTSAAIMVLSASSMHMRRAVCSCELIGSRDFWGSHEQMILRRLGEIHLRSEGEKDPIETAAMNFSARSEKSRGEFRERRVVS
jgi:hypothetical protein